MSSNKNWDLLIDPKTYKQLDKLPRKDSKKIIATLQHPDFNPYAGNIKKVKAEENVWRKRIGAYRIFYEINQSKNLVHIFWVERRTSKTYD